MSIIANSESWRGKLLVFFNLLLPPVSLLKMSLLFLELVLVDKFVDRFNNGEHLTEPKESFVSISLPILINDSVILFSLACPANIATASTSSGNIGTSCLCNSNIPQSNLSKQSRSFNMSSEALQHMSTSHNIPYLSISFAPVPVFKSSVSKRRPRKAVFKGVRSSWEM